MMASAQQQATSGNAEPSAAKPDTAKPDTAKPDTAKPGTAKPGTAKPDPTPERRPAGAGNNRRSLPERQPRRLVRTRRSFSSTRNSMSQLRFASVPDMFGDLMLRGGQITATETLTGIPNPGVSTTAGIPGPGGLRGTLVGENNRALPTDRIYFNYNQYRKPVHQTTLVDGTQPAGYADSSALQKYMLGFERTLFDGRSSLEARLPFFESQNINIPATIASPHANVASDGSEVGNLTLIFKHIFRESCTTVYSLGLAMELPTGNDASLDVGGTRYEFENEAVYLSPFLAVMYAPNQCFFANSFLQVTTPTSGNTLGFVALDGTGDVGEFGSYNDQTLIHMNLSLGRWIHRNPHSEFITGLATLAELHYTGTLQGADTVNGFRDVAGPFPEVAEVTLTPRTSDFHVVNAVLGLQFQIRQTTLLRVAGVAPLTDSGNRLFNSELSVQLGRRF